MIISKTEEEIQLLRESNLLVSKALAEICKVIRPGITTLELDKCAEEFIRDNGAIPGFLGYNGYPNTLCTSVNEEVVHGIPSSKKVLKEGDIISVDCGVIINGYYGDTAYTFPVGEISEEIRNLLEATERSLYLAVENAIAGNRIGDVGYAVQKYVEDRGYSVVREMVGHGLGKKLHEAPEVPNYGKRGKGIKLPEGAVICIEPMVNLGGKEIVQDNDGWTIRTADRKPSAHFEFAVAVKKGQADVLSSFKFIEEVLKNKQL